MLKTMHSFRQLNCLKIIESYNSLYLFPDSYFTIDLLNGCQKLTHLTIIYNNIETKLLEDIHLYLPQLTNLKITTNKMTIIQNFLVNMKKLKVIRIKGKNESKITDSGISHTISNFPEIQSICLNMTTEVTNESIDELIEEIAFKRPQI